MLNKKMLLSLLVIGVVSVSAGAGTWAYFTAEEETTGNTFTAGTVIIDLDPNAEGAVDDDTVTMALANNMKPGDDTTTATMVLNNVGTLPVDYTISTELIGDLIHVDDESTDGVDESLNNPYVSSIMVGGTAYDESIPDELSLDVAGNSGDIIVTITFPADADDTYQGQSGELAVTFSAEQQ